MTDAGQQGSSELLIFVPVDTDMPRPVSRTTVVNERDFATRRVEMELIRRAGIAHEARYAGLGEFCIERQRATMRGDVATLCIASGRSVSNSTGREFQAGPKVKTIRLWPARFIIRSEFDWSGLASHTPSMVSRFLEAYFLFSFGLNKAFSYIFAKFANIPA